MLGSAYKALLPPTELILDPDVKAVVEFIQRSFQCRRMVSIANGVAALAPILWGHWEAEDVETLRLQEPPITG